MKYPTLDVTLNIMILIFSALLLIIPIFYDLRNKEFFKDKKGKVIEIKSTGISYRGKIFIFVFLFALATGIVKAIRDDNTQNATKHLYSDSQKELSEKVDSLKLQYKLLDTIKKQLAVSGKAISKTGEILNAKMVVAGNNNYIDHLTIGGSRKTKSK